MVVSKRQGQGPIVYLLAPLLFDSIGFTFYASLLQYSLYVNYLVVTVTLLVASFDLLMHRCLMCRYEYSNLVRIRRHGRCFPVLVVKRNENRDLDHDVE